ncbi:cell division protein FtsQ [Virgibacillus natechei]|uniref:Cell division protein DivIB n=1 Tax=Virgibacillus natechei TaxID=1216297 RepID=A0ABS4IB83_9BACI|nr:FtsQ-type POTRA domain-containing protein [Virgibacillus natechei]MBP1968192.1 cell division protein FtsQ [Virgibacillus natechei]UZD14535.1 FtsQ-type POTRA domain-containing protein [Virgibacillus natechei]
MSKKKIVSIEDRIPKLKQARKKKANRRLIFYLSIFFILISIIVYLQSPLSHIQTINVTGNSFFDDEEIIAQSELTMSTNIWTINTSDITQAMSDNPIIKSVEISRKFPWTVDIIVNEHQRVGYVEEESNFHPILGNGQILHEMEQDAISGDAPLLVEFTEEEYLHRMAIELQELSDSILNLISEIHWNPTDDNPNDIWLYMNDGFMVSGTIRDFADRMQVYPSIISQLDPEDKGVIHIGVGAYFESFENDNDEDNQMETSTEE